MAGRIVSGAPADVAALLPHGPAARFVREIVSCDGESIVTRGAVPPDGPFVQDGLAPGVIALELAAQSAGLLEALARNDPPGAPAAIGYIVGLGELKVNGACVPAGRDLLARVALDGASRPLTIYRVSVALEDEDQQEVLAGKIKIFTTPGPGSPEPPRNG
jgi:predicted hotdog family 3-hydroxylacyl-ACP dehydratase